MIWSLLAIYVTMDFFMGILGLGIGLSRKYPYKPDEVSAGQGCAVVVLRLALVLFAGYALYVHFSQFVKT